MAIFKTLIDKFDRMMAAITFAEAGESETALDILYDTPVREKSEPVVRISRKEETQPRLRT